MGRVNTPKLDEQANLDLENGYKIGKNHAFCKRCHVILLESEHRKSKEEANVLKMDKNSVNFWVSGYKNEGIGGLKTKNGRGRKTLLDKEKIRRQPSQPSKNIGNAPKARKPNLSKKQAKKFLLTLYIRFLKVLAENTKGSGKG